MCLQTASCPDTKRIGSPGNTSRYHEQRAQIIAHVAALEHEEHVVDGDGHAAAVLRHGDGVMHHARDKRHQRLSHLLVHAARNALDACGGASCTPASAALTHLKCMFGAQPRQHAVIASLQLAVALHSLAGLM